MEIYFGRWENYFGRAIRDFFLKSGKIILTSWKFFFWQGRCENYFSGGKIILAGGKIILTIGDK